MKKLYILSANNKPKEEVWIKKKQNCYTLGDYPEAVLDGLYDAATKISWRDAKHKPSLRYIFHIADAPPHGKEFGHDS